jgi:hypothetical protein
MSDERDLRQERVAAELFAADARFDSWELANKVRVAELRARRVGNHVRDLHRPSALEHQDVMTAAQKANAGAWRSTIRDEWRVVLAAIG